MPDRDAAHTLVSNLATESSVYLYSVLFPDVTELDAATDAEGRFRLMTRDRATLKREVCSMFAWTVDDGYTIEEIALLGAVVDLVVECEYAVFGVSATYRKSIED